MDHCGCNMKNQNSSKPEHDKDCTKNDEYRRLSHRKLPPLFCQNRIPAICLLIFTIEGYPNVSGLPICGTIDLFGDFTSNEKGVSEKELCRRIGIGDAEFHQWNAQLQGIGSEGDEMSAAAGRREWVAEGDRGAAGVGHRCADSGSVKKKWQAHRRSEKRRVWLATKPGETMDASPLASRNVSAS